jgi:tetratricopeptide (TPR) repeat protein
MDRDISHIIHLLDDPHMMRHYQAKMLAQMNNLQSMQSEMHYWEKSDNYHKAVESHQRYIEFLKSNNAMIPQIFDAYIRMGKFCEAMGDRLLASDVYQEVVDLMIINRWDPLIISAVQSKISSLHYY